LHKKTTNIDTLKSIPHQNDWTLFLDRDGVINQRIPGDYIKTVEEFEFIPGSLEAIVRFRSMFHRIVVVTNQQGIGKGRMTEAQLSEVHEHMISEVKKAGGRIDKVYHCPKLAREEPLCRKPNIGMAIEAQSDFPGIDFKKSIIVGDSISDMKFGKRLGMKTVFITTKEEDAIAAAEMEFDLWIWRLSDLV